MLEKSVASKLSAPSTEKAQDSLAVQQCWLFKRAHWYSLLSKRWAKSAKLQHHYQSSCDAASTSTVWAE